MGTASSVVTLSPRGSIIDENYTGVSHKGGDRGSVKRNAKRIFDRQETSYDVDINSLLDGDYVDDATRSLLRNALKGFFFLQSNSEDVNPKMDLLIKGMKREEFDEGYTLITEGESGSKLYVVEDGSLEVTINGSLIRELSKGHMLGELALLYDAPRSATIQTKTKCSLWSLRREIFKKIQAISATANQLQRARWLIASPDLAVLSPIDLSRLVGTLQKTEYNPGDTIFTQGELSKLVVLIEKGHAKISSTQSFEKGTNKKEIDKALGIFRPREGKRRSVDNMNTGQLQQYLTNLNDSVEQNEEDGTAGVPVEAPYEDGIEALVEVYEGCMVGIAGLRGKASLDKGWKWLSGGPNGDGAEPPMTMTASTKMTCLTFTVEVFENLFGPVEQALQKASKKAATHAEEHAPAIKELQFDSAKFKAKYILGSGSFGVVTYAEYRADKTQPPTCYALKSLSKLAVIETGQIRHVLDERKLLSTMDSIFILRLYGTYQTPHQLVMVTEPLQCGDLWSVIYETPPFCDNCGIPFSLAAFYTASLVHALAHIHGKGVVFRDLKPENIMLDDKGYLRVIDFGFSKKVPYTKTESSGEVKVFNKTYTLCGTPEYLSPELIFNLGHNQASDIWALGVIVYEMLMAVTPFAPKRPDNVTELFTNIAMVKKNGLVLSSRIDQHAGNPQARVLISAILKADPNERIGTQEGSTRAILDHPFFSGSDVEGIGSGSVVPEFIPSVNTHHEPLSNLMPVRPFNGDQGLFADF